MPEMDGLSATGEIRRREVALGLPHLPIIALTAHIMPGDRERCLASGMDDYMSKPLNPDKLQATLAQWVTWAKEQKAAVSTEPTIKTTPVAPAPIASPKVKSVVPPPAQAPITNPAFNLAAPLSSLATDEDEARDNTALIFDVNEPFAQGEMDQEEGRDNTALIFDGNSAFGQDGMDQEEPQELPDRHLDSPSPSSPPVDFRILPSTDSIGNYAEEGDDAKEQLLPSDDVSSAVWENRAQQPTFHHEEEDPFAPLEDTKPRPEAPVHLSVYDAAAIFDLDEALDLVDGDKVLLSEMAELFLESYPGYLSRIKEALVQQDLTALTQAAHALKGSVGNFTTREPFEVARALEQIGRHGDIGQASQVVVKLEHALSQLTPELENLRQEVAV